MKPHVFVNNGLWGNSIRFMDFNSRSITGHSPKIPTIGDFLDIEMQSKRLFRFRFVSVDQMRDPKDMFFGKVEDVGYVDELS